MAWRIALLLLLLAAAPVVESVPVVEPEDVSETKFCFPESKSEAESTQRWFTSSPKLKLEIAGWQSQKVVTRMAEILLREKLGYHVQVLDFEAADRLIINRTRAEMRYERFMSGDVDMNLEVWPDNVPRAVQQAVLTSASDLGPVGYPGRSGWYIPLKSIENDASGPYGDSPWRSLSPLLAEQQHLLANHTRLPPPPSICESKPTHNVGFGQYDCENAEWTFEGAGCCSAGAAVAGTCASGLPPCAVLHVVSPSYDPGINERALAGSGLKLQIQYGSVTPVLEVSETTALPALI